MTCPKCGAPEDQLDWWIGKDDFWHWSCFECGHAWKVDQKNMKKDIDKEKTNE